MHMAGPGNGQSIALGTYTTTMVNTVYTPQRETDVENLQPDTLNTFDTRIPVAGTELIGLHIATGNVHCYYTVPSINTVFIASPAPPLGMGEQSYPNGQGNARANVAAVIEPDADHDGFGDETQDGCTTSEARQDDCVAPAAKIDKGPKRKTKKRKAKFAFSSSEANSTFTCAVDKKKSKPCTSPLKLKRVKPGKHTFTVVATDANANASAPAAHKWKVKR
jgi:hypothetical protein